MFEKLVLASNNAGKLKEFASLLGPLGITLVSQGELGVPECPEPHSTFLENALAKARHASFMTGLPAVADDSGLCVEVLEGAPGVMSARFAGEPRSDVRNNDLLVKMLQTQTNRRGWYTCTLVLVRHHRDPQPMVAEGIWHGWITDEARGINGFGYDPHFWLEDYGMTVAELDPLLKNQISHRGQAMQCLLNKLRAYP